MRNPELYKKTVDILVQAYFNDTLEHFNCAACAVGNIILASNGYEPVKKPLENWFGWPSDKFKYSDKSSWYDVINGGEPDEYANRLMNSTGYTWDELRMIENAFENTEYISNPDSFMFNGLMAVIEALDIIHDNKDTVLTEQSKKRFNKSCLA